MRWLRIIGATLALIGAVGIGFGLALEAAMIVALGIHFASFLEGCRCDIEKYDDFDTFVSKSKLNKAEVENYLTSL